MTAPLVNERTLSHDRIIARIRTGLLAARSDLAGVVIFGSFARGERWHDLDVLVVLREAITDRRARREIMRECQDAIGLVNVDVLPIHLDGLRRGLQNHVFILMEVAFDGLIVYDGGEIVPLLQAARDEITASGVRRTETGGWRFPVRYRQSTPLSPIANSRRAALWLEEAVRESQIAGELLRSGYFDRCAYHCQQSIERSVKAVLICLGAFERSHWVGRVLERELASQDVQAWKASLLELAALSREYEHAAVDARYILENLENEGDEVIWIPAEQYTRSQAAAGLEAARKALEVSRQFVRWWFAPGEESTD